jgi:hypothetical protein
MPFDLNYSFSVHFQLSIAHLKTKPNKGKYTLFFRGKTLVFFLTKNSTSHSNMEFTGYNKKNKIHQIILVTAVTG